MTRLMLRTQIVLLPVIAAVAFVLVIVINLALGRQSAHLSNIEKGYLPAFATTREAENLLTEVNRLLQDATMAQEEDRIADADARFAILMKKVDLLIANPTQERRLLRSIRRNIEHYYKSARTTTLSMIRNEINDQLQTDAASMVSQYNNVRQQLSLATTRGHKAMKRAFRKAYDANVLSHRINVSIAVAALIGLVAITFLVVRGVVGGLTKAINHLSTASTQIVSMTKQTENNATVEASAVRNTQQTMTVLVQAANDIAVSAGEVQIQSEKSIAASRLITDRVASLNEQALKISEISNAIHDIAFTSNILAFNASLEGTKAGDTGRGFLVVATEVRRVAEMVINAARQIKSLTSEMDEHSKAAIDAASDGYCLAESSTELSKRITDFTVQQKTSTEDMSYSMQDVQKFTEQTLAGAKQLKSTTDDLVITTENLMGLLSGEQSDVLQRKP